MNIESINKQVLKAERVSTQDKTLEQKLARELFKSESAKKIRPQDKADLLTLRLTPDAEKYFSSSRLERLRTLETSISNEDLLSSVIPNKHYFFISDLRERKLAELHDIHHLAKNYNIRSDDLWALKNEGFVDWLEANDKVDTPENRKSLIKRGFLSSLSEHEKFVLSSLQGKEIDIEEALKINPDIAESRLIQLKIKGHIHVLSRNELNFLKAGGKIQSLSTFGLESQDYYHLKKRIIFHQKGEVQSVDLSNLSLKEKDFLLKFKAKEVTVKDAPGIYGFSAEHSQRLVTRIKRYTGQEIRNINLQIQIDLEDKFDPTVKIYYREKLPILNFRERADLEYLPRLSYKDISIYLRGKNQENLSKRELDRLYELLAHKNDSFVSYIPTNTEIAFLEKINGRKGDLELILKIGVDDFNLPKDSIYHLLENNLINISSGYIKNEWIEPIAITSARIWQSTLNKHSFEESIKMLVELKIEEPNAIIKGLLQNNKPFHPPQSLEDYELFLKIHFKAALNSTEERRLHHLRENGIHPELNSSFLREEPASWNMRAARKQAFIHHFKERYQVDLKVIEFINKFKQVTHEQLLTLGLSNGDIERYIRGVSNEKIPFGGKILNRHTLNTPKGNILYYSIQHQGIVSGRSLLETRMGKEFVSQRPQQRQDLLFHDLKVVDCILQVRKELEEKGYKILEVKNESAQYSETKAGKSNDWRNDGPSFMDAVLIVEEPINEALSLSGGSKTIAVEYGNYTNGRIMSKIDNSDFDQAFVFSNQTFQQKYSNLVVTKNVAFRSI